MTNTQLHNDPMYSLLPNQNNTVLRPVFLILQFHTSVWYVLGLWLLIPQFGNYSTENNISLIVKFKVKYFHGYMTSSTFNISVVIIHTCSCYHGGVVNCSKIINIQLLLSMTTPYYVYTFGWLLLCHLILVILASWLHLRCAKTCFRMFYNHYAYM